MGIDVEMYVRVRPPLSDLRVGGLAREICVEFGAEQFVAGGPGPLEVVEPGIPVYGALSESAGVRVEQEADEQLICVHLLSRYYDETYERGDLPLIVAVAEWLERRIPRDGPSAEVWYGGDADSTPLRLFGAARRAELLHHHRAPKRTCSLCGAECPWWVRAAPPPITCQPCQDAVRLLCAGGLDIAAARNVRRDEVRRSRPASPTVWDRVAADDDDSV